MQLDDTLTDTFPVSEGRRQGLRKLELETIRDLLYHFPNRYIVRTDYRSIDQLSAGDEVVLAGTVHDLETKKSYRQGIPMAVGTLRDETGEVDLVWFHQPYIAQMLDEGQAIELTGEVSERSGDLHITNPEYKPTQQLGGSGLFKHGQKGAFILPVYSAADGVSSKWLYHTIRKILQDKELRENLQDPLPETVRQELSLPVIDKALAWIHTPQKYTHKEIARKRFSFEEVLTVQIVKKLQRRSYATQKTFPIEAEYGDLDTFLKRFDFTPTDAQRRAIEEILQDFRTDGAMSRLLEGDVGSGKTFVAAATAYAAVTTSPENREYGHLQTAYMAPTEILAQQQFESFVDYFAHLPIDIGLMTGSGCRKFPSKIDDTAATDISRSQLLTWIEEGVTSIVFGTHSLIQDDIVFDNLAYVIIDEQHRFGVSQRKQLVDRDGPLPHLLSMTATPIPRTLALTMHGDLDLSVIDELPPGREIADTKLVKEQNRSEVYDALEQKIEAGEQAYVVCPQIEKPDNDSESSSLEVMSVAVMEEKMQQRFPNYTVDILHGRMNNADKEDTMQAFANGNIDILVATSVIEVGVDVPNATSIIIENAERFGLAQLHQLRGRVQRSQKQAHCFLFADIQSEKTRKRLQAMESARDGFELAQKDLEIRGPGALVGKRQSGISDVAMDALNNIDLVEIASEVAESIISEDPQLERHPNIKARVQDIADRSHFE